MARNEKELQLKIGTATEKFIAKTFKNYGYWVYNMPLKINGQPCDLIAVKGIELVAISGTIAWLIDAKHVREDEVSFPFSRIEPNQTSSMSYAVGFAKIPQKYVGFAVFFERDKTLYWLSYQELVKMTNEGKKSVNMKDLPKLEEVIYNADNNQ